jgi:multidrug resistance efflux pump
MNLDYGVRGMKKLSMFFVVMAAAVLVLTACSPKTAQPAAAAPSQPDVLIAEGRLLPVNSMDQSFSTPGQVAEVLVKDGEMVKAGQVLARLAGAPEAQTALARARQELLAAQQALDGLKTSADLHMVQGQLAVVMAQKELDKAQVRYAADNTGENKALLDEATAKLNLVQDAQTKLEAGAGIDPDQRAAFEARLVSAQAAAASAQSMVDSAELKSSLDGTVVSSSLQVGQKVAAGQPGFTVADFSSWVVKTNNLTEMGVVKVKVGQKVSVSLDALPGQALSGEVTDIKRLYEEKRGDITYTVSAVLNQTDPQMRWGMTAAVQFIP